MYNYKITEQVKRKPKRFSGLLRRLMVIFAVIMLLMGVMLSQGFMLPGFLLVLLYFIYTPFSEREYEYILEGTTFTIHEIAGKKYRRQAHRLDLKDLEVLAPHWHEEVSQYRRDGGSIRLPKYDYTSYCPDTPYYTMIIMEDRQKIKLLLDLNDEMLQVLKKHYPNRVFL